MDTTTVSVTIDMGPVAEVSSDNKPKPMDTSTSEERPGVLGQFDVLEVSSKVNQFIDVKNQFGEQAETWNVPGSKAGRKRRKRKKAKHSGVTNAGSLSKPQSQTPQKPPAVKRTKNTGGNIPGFQSNQAQNPMGANQKLKMSGNISGFQSNKAQNHTGVKQTLKTGGNIPGFQSYNAQEITGGQQMQKNQGQKPPAVKQTLKNQGQKPTGVKLTPKTGGNIPGFQSYKAQEITSRQQMQKNQGQIPAVVKQTPKNQGQKPTGVEQTLKTGGNIPGFQSYKAQEITGGQQMQKDQGQKPAGVKQTLKNQGQKFTGVKQTQKIDGNIPGFQTIEPQLKTGTKQLQQSPGRGDGAHEQKTQQSKQNKSKKGTQPRVVSLSWTGFVCSAVKTPSQEGDQSQKSKPPNESLCPMQGCFVDTDLRAHILQKHIPSVFYDYRLKFTINDPLLLEQRVTGLRMLADALIDPGLDAHHLVKFYNETFQSAKHFNLSNSYVYAMQALCRYVGWDIPDEFTVCPVNHPAVLIHWAPLARLLSLIPIKTRKSIRRQLNNPNVLLESIEKGKSDIPKKHELTLENLDQDIKKFKKWRERIRSKRKHNSNSESSDLGDPKVSKLSLNSEEGVSTFDQPYVRDMLSDDPYDKDLCTNDPYIEDMHMKKRGSQLAEKPLRLGGRGVGPFEDPTVNEACFEDRSVEDGRRKRLDTFENTNIDDARYKDRFVEEGRRMDIHDNTSVDNARFLDRFVEDDRRMRMNTFENTNIDNARFENRLVENSRRMGMDTFKDTNIDKARFVDRLVEDGGRMEMDNFENTSFDKTRFENHLSGDRYVDSRFEDGLVEDGRRMGIDTFVDTNIDNARFEDRFVENGRRMKLENFENTRVENARFENPLRGDRYVDAPLKDRLVEEGRRMGLDTFVDTNIDNTRFEDRFVEKGRRMKMENFENTKVDNACFENRLVEDRYVDAQNELQLERSWSDTRPARGSLMSNIRLGVDSEMRPLQSRRLPGMVVDDDFEDVLLERGVPVAPSEGFRTMSAGGRISENQSRISELGVADQSRESSVHVAKRQVPLAGYDRPTTGFSRLQAEYVAPKALESAESLHGSAAKSEATQVPGSNAQPVQRPPPSMQVQGSYAQPVQRPPPPFMQMPGSVACPGVMPPPIPLPGSYPWPGVIPPPLPMPGFFQWPGLMPPPFTMPGPMRQPDEKPAPALSVSQQSDVKSTPVSSEQSVRPSDRQPPNSSASSSEQRQAPVSSAHNKDSFSARPTNEEGKKTVERNYGNRSKPNPHSFQTRESTRDGNYQKNYSHSRSHVDGHSPSQVDSHWHSRTDEHSPRGEDRHCRSRIDSPPRSLSVFGSNDRRNPQAKDQGRNDNKKKKKNHHNRPHWSDAGQREEIRKKKKKPWWMDEKLGDYKKVSEDYELVLESYRKVQKDKLKEAEDKKKEREVIVISPTSDPDDSEEAQFGSVAHYKTLFEGIRPANEERRKPVERHDGNHSHQTSGSGGRASGSMGPRPTPKAILMGPPPTPKAILTERGTNYWKHKDNTSDSTDNVIPWASRMYGSGKADSQTGQDGRNTAKIPSLFSLNPTRPSAAPSGKSSTVTTTPSSGEHFRHSAAPGGQDRTREAQLTKDVVARGGQDRQSTQTSSRGPRTPPEPSDERCFSDLPRKWPYQPHH